GASAEIYEVHFAPANRRLRRINRKLLQRGVNVTFDRRRILVRVNAKITKVAALAAKRNVQVNPQWVAGLGRSFERGIQVAELLLFPKGKGRIIGNKIIAYRG